MGNDVPNEMPQALRASAPTSVSASIEKIVFLLSSLIFWVKTFFINYIKTSFCGFIIILTYCFLISFLSFC
ncbi:MAG: hypothetical protein QG627_565 [Chlamydiota bacterium]|nr:hypothetical protein [Chlamydiota bacterium]